VITILVKVLPYLYLGLNTAKKSTASSFAVDIQKRLESVFPTLEGVIIMPAEYPLQVLSVVKST